MLVRYHITNQPELKEIERAMKPVGTDTPGGRRVWELPGEPIPTGAVLAFDFIYYIAGNLYKEDNQGQYFVAAPVQIAAARG